jgi:predicted Zn-dependent protease with MMP-like domain
MADPMFSDPLVWRSVKAPSIEELEVLAETAFRRLPQKFRALCEGLVIRVEDFPEEAVLDELGAQTEFDLLGLFQGVGLPFRSESAPTQMPNMIWLYRRPILDYWAEHDETQGFRTRRNSDKDLSRRNDPDRARECGKPWKSSPRLMASRRRSR